MRWDSSIDGEGSAMNVYHQWVDLKIIVNAFIRCPPKLSVSDIWQVYNTHGNFKVGTVSMVPTLFDMKFQLLHHQNTPFRFTMKPTQ